MSITNAFNRIKREAGVKRCIIVEGNVNDVYLLGRELNCAKDAIKKILKDSGYEDVVVWDRITGIEGDVSSLKLTEDDEEEEGDEYDIGDVDLPSNDARGSCRELRDVFNLIERTMTDRTHRTAFILDWSEYLFSTGGQLDVDDREYLTLLGKSLRDIVPRYNDPEKQSTIVLIVSKTSMVPLAFYSGNPEVSIVTLTKPDLA